MTVTVTATDDALRARALAVYKPHCRYLTSLALAPDTARGTFAIPASCYIDDTGHLNAAEVTICYNQLLYSALAAAIRDGAAHAPPGWSLDDYWRLRLSAVVITRMSTDFHRPVTPRSFTGELAVGRSLTRRFSAGAAPTTVLETSFRFEDGNGGRAGGTARIAVLGDRDHDSDTGKVLDG
ncbi:hypothetical protein HUT13_09605 [Streptomyces harbinensis]|uniref:FcoT family thioesterase n=1 Tax=Streptomyces harbinensis TaxID=1176198 RepID=UPI00159254C8|nr:FcoT family thioesterase [Streptomyces harbinensis]QKV69012.1 hypothetical protein HUT13_09605 [Streptomyces harbinensis]